MRHAIKEYTYTHTYMYRYVKECEMSLDECDMCFIRFYVFYDSPNVDESPYIVIVGRDAGM